MGLLLFQAGKVRVGERNFWPAPAVILNTQSTEWRFEWRTRPRDGSACLIQQQGADTAFYREMPADHGEHIPPMAGVSVAWHRKLRRPCPYNHFLSDRATRPCAACARGSNFYRWGFAPSTSIMLVTRDRDAKTKDYFQLVPAGNMNGE